MVIFVSVKLKEFLIHHQKSGIQYQLVKWNKYLIYIPSLFAVRPG